MDADEEAALRVCSVPHCSEPVGIGCCTGSTPHPLCDACFRGYASAQFETSLGAFEQVLSKNGGISKSGELPCYLFLTDECDCTSIPSTTLARVLGTDPEVLEAYENAKRRLIRTQYDMERENENHDEPDLEDGLSLKDLLEAVTDALSRGGYVECPSCGKQGQKNAACMHMKCPCGTRYCYCCGRRRDDGPWEYCKSDGTGCDSPSAYLENHPGWRNFALSGESLGIGALHEFHRRRMAYFLRDVKDSYPPKLWRKLQRTHPTILDGKPTNGRCISWEEVETASAPLFGRTTEAQLKWRIRPDLSMRSMLESADVPESEREEDSEAETVVPEEQPREGQQVVPEEEQDDDDECRVPICFVGCLVLFFCCFCTGVGLFASNDKGSRPWRAGIMLMSVGLTGVVAQVLTRCFTEVDGTEPKVTAVVVHGICFGFLMGSLMVAFAAQESPAFYSGFGIIVLFFLLYAIACDKAQDDH